MHACNKQDGYDLEVMCGVIMKTNDIKRRDYVECTHQESVRDPDHKFGSNFRIWFWT